MQGCGKRHKVGLRWRPGTKGLLREGGIKETEKGKESDREWEEHEEDALQWIGSICFSCIRKQGDSRDVSQAFMAAGTCLGMMPCNHHNPQTCAGSTGAQPHVLPAVSVQCFPALSFPWPGWRLRGPGSARSSTATLGTRQVKSSSSGMHGNYWEAGNWHGS